MILTVTPNPTIDMAIEVDWLVPEHKLPAELTSFQPGGGGVNVSRVLHSIGLDTLAIVAVGGVSGDVVMTRLADKGIPAIAVPVVGHTRWAETIHETSTNKEYRLVTPGPAMSESEWRSVLAAVDEQTGARRPDTVVFSGALPPGVPPEFVRELAAAAHRRGSRFVADTKGPALVAAVEAGADVVKPSRRELATLVGVQVDPATFDSGEGFDVVRAARAVRERGAKAVVVSLGPHGAFLCSGEAEAFVRPPHVKVLTTVGSGDSMVAGILAGLRTGRSLLDATRLGVAVGTANCVAPAGAGAKVDVIDDMEAKVTVEPVPAPA